jgi:hypothetical protein
MALRAPAGGPAYVPPPRRAQAASAGAGAGAGPGGALAGPGGALAFFETATNGSCRLAPAGLAKAFPDARARFDLGRFRECGGAEGGADDAARAVAAASGVLANTAFLEIVDEHTAPAACFCCRRAKSRAHAAEADGQIKDLLGYFAPESYAQTLAHYRLLAALTRDATPAELAAVRRRAAAEMAAAASADAAPAFAAAIGAAAVVSRVPGVVAIPVAHAPPRPASAEEGLLGRAGVALWVCSTPESRRFLRRLGRACQAAGLKLVARVAPSAESVGAVVRLRHKARSYVLECHPADAGAAPAAALAGFWATVRAAAKAAPEKARGGRPAAARRAAAPARARGAQDAKTAPEKARGAQDAKVMPGRVRGARGAAEAAPARARGAQSDKAAPEEASGACGAAGAAPDRARGAQSAEAPPGGVRSARRKAKATPQGPHAPQSAAAAPEEACGARPAAAARRAAARSARKKRAGAEQKSAGARRRR